MIVDEDIALERINSKDNLINKLGVAVAVVKHETVEIKPLHHERTGPKNVPPIVQAMIVTDCAMGMTQENAAAPYGLDQSTANRYVNGKSGQTDIVANRINDIHTRAVDAMIDSLDKVKSTLPNVKRASEASAIAANLARVIDKTSPKEAEKTNVKIVLYSPRIKEEGEYIEVEVS